MATNKPNRNKVRYRLIEWIDIRDGVIYFGIEARRKDWKKPKHASMGNRPLIYSDRAIAKRNTRWLNNPKGTEPEWAVGL